MSNENHKMNSASASQAKESLPALMAHGINSRNAEKIIGSSDERIIRDSSLCGMNQPTLGFSDAEHNSKINNTFKAHTALLLMNLQNEYFLPSGKLFANVYTQGGSLSTRANLIVAELSKFDTLMVYLPLVYDQSDFEENHNIQSMNQLLKQEPLKAGTTGAEFCNCIKSPAPIMHMPARNRFNAFHDASLHQTLMENDIGNLIMIGADASLSIDFTARAGFELGYDVFIISDCMMSNSEKEHEIYCETIFPKFAQVMTTDQLLEELK